MSSLGGRTEIFDLEGGPKSLISRWGTRAERALNIVGIDKQNTGLIQNELIPLFPYFLIPFKNRQCINLELPNFETNLFPYFPVLDLLHAHGDSPEERCSSRLVPFAIRTRFAPSVRKSAISLFPLKPLTSKVIYFLKIRA